MSKSGFFLARLAFVAFFVAVVAVMVFSSAQSAPQLKGSELSGGRVAGTHGHFAAYDHNGSLIADDLADIRYSRPLGNGDMAFCLLLWFVVWTLWDPALQRRWNPAYWISWVLAGGDWIGEEKAK